MAGRLTEARTLAQRYTDFAELQQPGRAIGETLVGYVAIAQGDFDAAVTLLSRAADPLAPHRLFVGPAVADAAGAGARPARRTTRGRKGLSAAPSRGTA